jgi:hypothetical protein
MGMKYFVGVTDNSWFEFLANLKPDEVNFWRPSGKLFRAEVSSPFVSEDSGHLLQENASSTS